MISSRVLLAAAAAVVVSSQRVTVSLNFGVRTAPDTAAPPTCDTSEYNISLANQRCMGLSSLQATDPTSCAAAACSAGAQCWQWLAGQGCWAGSPDSCGPSGDAWAGAAAPAPLPGPPAPPAGSPPAQPGYDDSAWLVVDTPHDATITGAYSPTANGGEAFLPSPKTWYRKRFIAPAAWAGSAVTLVVDAALSTTTWWLNGKQVVVANPAGYLPSVLRLDTLGLNFSDTTPNVLVAYTDGTETTGWWYEGSGLIRSFRLVVSSAAASVAPMGVAMTSFVQGAIHANSAAPADGLYADTVVLAPSVATFGSSGGVTAAFTLYAADGATVVAAGSASGRAGDTLAPSPLTVGGPVQLWSVARPYLYTLAVALSVGGKVVDAVNETVSVRGVAWDSEKGLLLNEQAVKMRGACNHESFTGVGAALPDRIDLLRVQQLRGAGGNAWRTSHNPPEPVLLDIADRLGLLVLDENRVLATQTNCDGCSNVPQYFGSPAADVGALAMRDRNHASVIWYSLCNEAGCGNGTLLNGDLVELAKTNAYLADGSRAVGANMGWISPINPGTPMSTALDVMGCSHCNRDDMLKFHIKEPQKPLVMTECCSCENQRGEDADMPHNSTLVHYNDDVSDCLSGQVSTSDQAEWIAGTFVWTFHDYIGEPGAWPHVSSSFGAIDLAGFPKPPTWWYRAVWLANISAADAGRPPLPAAATATSVRIVESWQAPVPPATTRTIHVLTNAPLAQLLVNGAPWGAPQPVPFFLATATFHNVSFAPGALTARALAADGATVLASHTTNSWGAPAALRLSLDVPSLATGTGSAVFVDGADVALLRAAVLDAAGHVVLDSTLNISFAVTAGPGFVAGVGNGDPACQEPSHAPWRSAYHGLARAIVRVTLDASGSPAERALRAAVNVEAGRGAAGRSSTILLGPAGAAPTNITVTASAPGLPPATFVVPLSVDPADSVLAVAAASVGSADVGANDDY